MRKFLFNISKYLKILFLIFSYQLAHAQDHLHSHVAPTKSNDCNSRALECANAATPFITNDDQLWVVWTSGGAVSIAKSKDFGKSFEQAQVLAEHGKSLDTGGDARPQIIVDQKDRVVIAYAFFKDSQWNAQINTMVSMDKGLSFSKPQSIVRDETSQRFPVMLLQEDNQILMSWIDKRLVAQANKTGVKKLGGSIAYGWLDQNGKIIGKELIANQDTCECCRIGVAQTKDRLPILVYRAILPNSIRDHVIQTIPKNGTPGQIYPTADDQWKTDSCPHHGPSIAVSQNGSIHVAWYTQGSNRSGVFYASSSNKGQQFSVPTRLGSEGSNVGRPYMMADGSKVYLVWKEFDGQSSKVYLQISSDDGMRWSDKKLVSQTSGYSDHPLLIKSRNKVYLSWLTRLNGYQLISLEK